MLTRFRRNCLADRLSQADASDLNSSAPAWRYFDFYPGPGLRSNVFVIVEACISNLFNLLHYNSTMAVETPCCLPECGMSFDDVWTPQGSEPWNAFRSLAALFPISLGRPAASDHANRAMELSLVFSKLHNVFSLHLLHHFDLKRCIEEAV